MKNTTCYVLAFENDYNSIFTLVMEVNFTKMPWDIDDEFGALVEYAYELAASTSVSLDDYTLKSISYGGTIIVTLD